MDELGFTLAGFAVLGVLHYAVAIVFAVSEYRKWRPTGWVIPLAVVMFVAFSFIFPVVEHIVRPKMRACGVDRRIIRLKLVLAWSVPLLTSVGIKLCELFATGSCPAMSPGSWPSAAVFRADSCIWCLCSGSM